MKLHPGQLDRLGQSLVDQYREQDFIVSQGDDEELKRIIAEVVQRNFTEEEKLEQDARKLLASHTEETSQLDMHKAILLVKQRLAEKRGFVL